ncbi:MAG: folate-binding protein YgfZ [Acidimicrobiales bacterium]|nr:folate-binding protein YgfZ [Acidimicrobiales bacterium]
MTVWAYAWPRDVVRIAGVDTEKYLQGQLSQDVSFPVGERRFSLVLEPQGKIDAWFRLHRLTETEYLADLDAGSADALIARLERFKLRSDVTITPEPAWRCLAIRGGEAAAVAATIDGELKAPLVGPWPGFEGVDVLGPGVEAPRDLEIVDEAAFEHARIAAGFPAMGSELTADVIPAATGVVDVSASFTKGCYTGQELVARVESRGSNTPTKLHRLTVADGVAVGASVTQAGAEVGTITSAARNAALAYLKRSVDAEAPIEVAGQPATLVGLAGQP